MGGEPYRIMELTSYVGVERATSSVILYVMMHIFSHFCFWLSSVLIYVFFYPVGWGMGIVLGLITLFCLLLVTLFIKGYRNGMAVACIRLGSHIPFLKKHAVRFAELHKEKLETIPDTRENMRAQEPVLQEKPEKTPAPAATTQEPDDNLTNNEDADDDYDVYQMFQSIKNN